MDREEVEGMRIRTIKPEFFLHDRLFDAERAEELPLRLSFIGLWCASDRSGRFKWEPRRLGASILPYDGVEFSRVLDALATRGFIEKHASQGVEFGFIPAFSRHQVINNRESPSSLPHPTAESMVIGLPTREPRVTDVCGTREVQVEAEGKGREGKGTGKESSSHEQASRILSTDWTPLQEHQDLCAVRRLTFEAQLSRFRDRTRGDLDSDQGWGDRFTRWLATGRPEPAAAPPSTPRPLPAFIQSQITVKEGEKRKYEAQGRTQSAKEVQREIDQLKGGTP